jgi:hypothetical protein
MPRPQFSIQTLLWLALVLAAFLGGIGFEKERRWRVDQRRNLYWDGSRLEYWPMTPEFDREHGARDRRDFERELELDKEARDSWQW